MEFWIDVEDASGNKLGEGPITTAMQWQSTPRLDEAGEFSFAMPANDPRSLLLQPKRIVRCWALLDGAVTEIGAGIIDQISVTVGDPLEMHVSGPDLLQELAERTIPELNICEQQLTYLTLDPTSGDWRGAVRELRNTWGTVSDNDLPAAHDAVIDSGGSDFRLYKEADEHAVYLYVGCDARFDEVHIWMGATINEVESTLTGQYYSETGWKDLTNLVDGTKSQNFSGEWCTFRIGGVITFDRPADWARNTPTLAAGSWFWVRFCVQSGQQTTDPINLREAAVLADVPTTNGVNQIMAYAPDTWQQSGYAATTTAHYLEVRGESVLAALRALAEQGGQSGGSAVRDHFRLATSSRAIDWFSAWTTSTVRAQRAGVDTAGDDDICQIIRARRQQNARKLLTRIYPLSRDDITLLETTRSAPAGYTLNKGLNYLQHDTAVATYGRVEATVRFSDVSMQQDDTLYWHREMAANALFDRALEHLRTHCTPEQFYALEVAQSVHLFRPGERIHVVYQEYRDGVLVFEINTYADNEPLYILAPTIQVRSDGLHTIALEVATADRFAATDAGTLIGGIQDAQRNAGIGATPSTVLRPIVNVTAEDGTIAGWYISPTELSANQAILGSGGYLRLGSGNDLIELNALDATYRLWAGHSVGASAPFSVSKGGAVKATLGEIAGWTIAAATLSKQDAVLSSEGYLALGTGNNIVRLDAQDETYRLWAGHATAASAPFSVTAAGAMKATAGTIGGWTISATILSATNLELESTGVVNVGSTTAVKDDNVIRLAANNATYRLWAGKWDAAAAPFSVTKEGAILATSGTVGGWTLGPDNLTGGSGDDVVVLSVGDETYRLWAGAAVAGDAPFSVTKAGVLKASLGTIGGWTISANSLVGGDVILHYSGYMQIGEAPAILIVDATDANYRLWAGAEVSTNAPFRVHADGSISSADYVAGAVAWMIDSTGHAEFNDVLVRGTLRSTVFQKDVVQAHSGTLIIGKTAAVLAADYTVGGTMDVVTPPGGGWVFETGDVVYIKEEGAALGLSASWVTVTRTATLNRYTTVKQSGASDTFRRGMAVVNYGQSGQGILLLTADLPNGPYYDVQTHSGSPWSAITTAVRLGNLDGVVDADLSPSGYGLYCDRAFLKGALIAADGDLVLDADGISMTVADGAIQDIAAYRFMLDEATVGGLYGHTYVDPYPYDAIVLNLYVPNTAGYHSELNLWTYAPSGKHGQVYVSAGDDGGIGNRASMYLYSSLTQRYFDLQLDEQSVIRGIAAEVVVNEPGLDRDFRVEGDTDPNLLFVDASTDRVGIGKNNPSYKMDVYGDVAARRLYLCANDDPSQAPSWYMKERSNDSSQLYIVGAPRATLNTLGMVVAGEGTAQCDVGISLYALDYDTAANPMSYGGLVLRGYSASGDLDFYTTKIGVGAVAGDITFSPDSTERLRLKSGGAFRYAGDLTPYRNSTEYTAYAYVPLATPLTSTSWDGDARSTTATTSIDTSVVFGVPAGIKAALVRLIARDSGSHPQTNLHVTLSSSSDMLATPQLSVRPPGADILSENCDIVNCNANGDFYYTITASGSGTMDVWISIKGYFI